MRRSTLLLLFSCALGADSWMPTHPGLLYKMRQWREPSATALKGLLSPTNDAAGVDPAHAPAALHGKVFAAPGSGPSLATEFLQEFTDGVERNARRERDEAAVRAVASERVEVALTAQRVAASEVLRAAEEPALSQTVEETAKEAEKALIDEHEMEAYRSQKWEEAMNLAPNEPMIPMKLPKAEVLADEALAAGVDHAAISSSGATIAAAGLGPIFQLELEPEPKQWPYEQATQQEQAEKQEQDREQEQKQEQEPEQDREQEQEPEQEQEQEQSSKPPPCPNTTSKALPSRYDENEAPVEEVQPTKAKALPDNFSTFKWPRAPQHAPEETEM